MRLSYIDACEATIARIAAGLRLDEQDDEENSVDSTEMPQTASVTPDSSAYTEMRVRDPRPAIGWIDALPPRRTSTNGTEHREVAPTSHGLRRNRTLVDRPCRGDGVGCSLSTIAIREMCARLEEQASHLQQLERELAALNQAIAERDTALAVMGP